jgi:hypothetical protein
MPHMDAIKGMTKLIFSLDMVNDKYTGRERECEMAMAQFASQGFDQTSRAEGRITQVQTDADECADVAEPAELEACAKSCKAASDKIEALTKDIHVKKNQKPDYDLSKEPFNTPTVSPFKAELEALEKLVADAEEKVYGVLKVRREFQAALADLEAGLTASSEKLDNLAADGKRCVEAEMTEVADVISKGYKMLNELENIKAAAKDAAGFRAKAADFVAQVESAEKTVRDAQAELARREAERAERLACTSKIHEATSKMSELMREAKKKIERRQAETMMQYEERMYTVNSRATKCLSASNDKNIAELKAEVEMILGDMNKLIADVEKDVKEIEEKGKAKMAGLMKLWGGGGKLTEAPPEPKVSFPSLKKEQSRKDMAYPTETQPPPAAAPEPEPAKVTPEAEPAPAPPAASALTSAAVPLSAKVKTIKNELGIDPETKMKEALMEACEQLGLEPDKNMKVTADAILVELGL